MPEPEQPPSLALGRYVTVVRRRWRVVAIVLVLGVIAAIGYLQVAAQQVTASTVVNVSVISTEPFSTARSSSELLDAATEQQVASSSTVADLAADSLSSDVTGEDLRSGLTVTLLAEATVMRIAYTADSTDAAREGADAVADAYLSYRTDRADSRKQGSIDNLDERLDELRSQLRKATKRLDAATTGTAQYAQAESDRQLLTIEIDAIVTQISQIQQIDTESGEVLTSAADNAVSSEPRAWLVLATGVLGGLALGLVSAFVVNTLDRRIRDQGDVEGAGAGQILSRLGERTAVVPAAGADLDAFRVARERLLATMGSERRTLAIIDGTRGPSPSDVAMNLAVVLAETARRVEVVVPESHHGDVAELKRALNLTPSTGDGLGEMLISGRIAGLEMYLPHPDESTLDGDTTGVVRSVVGDRREEDRFTVIALPPKASAASRLAAGRLADAVVMVIEESFTRIDDIAQVASEVREVGSQVVGVVVVPPGRSTTDAVEPDPVEARA